MILADKNRMSAKESLAKLKKINSKYQTEHKKQIPYFKRIIEELKKIEKWEDINSTINILKMHEEYCGKNTKKYSGNEIMPIMSLFTTTNSFLKKQKEEGRLVSDFKFIHDYNLNELVTTEEDKISLAITNKTIVRTPTPPNSKDYQIRRSNSLPSLLENDNLILEALTKKTWKYSTKNS